MRFNKKLILTVTATMALMGAGSLKSFASLTADQRMADFQQLVSSVERNYGPLQWKKTSIGLDWNKHVETYRALVATAKNDREFNQLLAKFLAGLQDAHVSSAIASTLEGTLGFTTDLIDGKVVIEKVDRLRLPEELFPFKKGDELVALGGVPVAAAMAEIDWAAATGYKMSADRIDAARLTSRREARGLTVPKGFTTVTALPAGAATPVTVMATWITKGLPVLEQDDLSDLLDSNSTLNFVQNASADNLQSLLSGIKSLSLFNEKLSKETLEDLASIGIADIGSPKTMFETSLPANFVRLNDGALPMKSDITSGVYQAGGKKIGLIRIPQFDGDNVDPNDGLPVTLKFIALNVLAMEPTTDALVIDIANNPGGSVDLVTKIVSFFARESAKDMMFAVRSSMKWEDQFSSISTEIDGLIAKDPKGVTDDGKAALALQARFRFLDDEMRDAIVNKRFSTTPVSLNLTGSFGMIQPQPKIHYSKPILMLINEFDFSGGDAFPAIMKDNGIVTLFGNRTSGAGGNVAEYPPLTNSYFKYHLTESLMIRPNGQYVENLGVKPDVEYKVTMDDFMNGYRGYFEAFTREAVRLAGGDVNAPIPAAAPPAAVAQPAAAAVTAAPAPAATPKTPKATTPVRGKKKPKRKQK